VIQRFVQDPLAEALLQGELMEKDAVRVDVSMDGRSLSLHKL
jgi:ATP-dependent Clp protease ATP-binding subunit ClpA